MDSRSHQASSPLSDDPMRLARSGRRGLLIIRRTASPIVHGGGATLGMEKEKAAGGNRSSRAARRMRAGKGSEGDGEIGRGS